MFLQGDRVKLYSGQETLIKSIHTSHMWLDGFIFAHDLEGRYFDHNFDIVAIIRQAITTPISDSID